MKSTLRAVVAILYLHMASAILAQGNKPDLVWMRGGIVGTPTDLNYSPDGNLLVSCDNSYGNGTVKLWRISDGMCLRTINTNAKFAQFNPTGELVAGVAPDGVYFWHVPDGRLVRKILSGGGNLRCFAMSPDWGLVATGSDDKAVRVFAASDGSPLQVFTGHTAAVDSVAFSPDGAQIVSGAGSNAQGNEQKWRTWNLASGLPDKVVSGPTVVGSGEVNVSYKVSFSPDGLSVILDIFCAYLDHCMYLAATGVLANHYTIAPYGSQSYINGANQNNWQNAVRVSPDGSLGAVTGRQAVVLFNYQDGTEVRTSRQGIEGPYYGGVGTSSLCFSPDGATLAVGTGAGEYNSPIQFWAAADGSFLSLLTPPGRSGSLPFLAASSDGQTIASGPGGLTLHKAGNGQPYFNAGYSVDSVAFSPDSTICAFCGVDGVGHHHLIVLRTSDGSSLRDIYTGDNFVKVQFAPDGKYLAVLVNSAYIYAYNVSDWTLAFTLTLSASRFWLSPDGRYLATAAGGFNLYAWPSGTFVKNVDVPGNGSGDDPLAWSPDSQSLVVLLNAECRKLSVPDLGETWRSAIPCDGSDKAQFSPDGQVIAVTSQASAKLMLLNAANGNPLTAYDDETYFNAGQGAVKSVAYSADGKFLYYGRGDGTLCCALNPYRNAVFPTKGGNTGNVTVKIITPDTFPVADGTIVTLRDGLHPDIAVNTTRVNDHVLTMTFDLRGAPVGVRDVVIDVPSGGTRTYPQGFTIEEGGSAQIRVSALGRSRVRVGAPAIFQGVVENVGLIDAANVLARGLALTLPDGTVSAGRTSALFTSLPPGVGSGMLPFPRPNIVPGCELLKFKAKSDADSCEEIRRQIRAKETELNRALGALTDVIQQILQNGCNIHPDTPDCVILISRKQALQEEVARLETELEQLQKQLRDCEDDELDSLSAHSASGSTSEASMSYCSVTSFDPNELNGPLGFTDLGWVSGRLPLPYVVSFENQPSATAPAAEVFVIDHIDATRFDLTTVMLGEIRFGDQVVTPTEENSPPVGMREFHAEVPLPDRPLTVVINAKVDMLTGDLTWHLIARDADGNMPPADPTAGFLDPGVGGSMLFSVLPKKGIPTGTVVTNQAEITFDYNAPLPTNTWSNTLDSDPPVSKVAKLAAAQTTSKFTVKWPLATDIGSGVKDFTIYVSDSNGPYQPWLTNTTLTQASFTGVGGHTYGFYSIARDNAYNLEPAPAAPDTSTTVKLCPDHVALNPATVAGSLPSTGTVVLTGPAPSGGALVVVTSANTAIATVPPTVTIPEGQTTASFQITTTAVTIKTPVKITAKYNGTAKSATLNIRPIGVLSVLLNPSTVKGGNPSTGTVTLEAPAAPGDITVTLTSSSTAATVTSPLVIPAGQPSGPFTINTTAVTSTKYATIKAAANAISKTAKLTITK